MNTIVEDKPIEDKGKAEEAPRLDMMDILAREGARKMLLSALEEEVAIFLGRCRHERSKRELKGYRNGTRERKLQVMGTSFDLPIPRVRGCDFHSTLIKPYQRRSHGVDELFRQLYVEGLSSRDFEPALRALIGDAGTLSPSTIQRLAGKFQKELTLFLSRDLSPKQYAYVWADGVYIKAGLDKEKTALLVLVGVTLQGKKELISVLEGYRESRDSWREIWQGVHTRGMKCPWLIIGDGIAGLWDAVAEVYPQAQDQRCWKHKMVNILDKLPKPKQAEVLERLRVAYQAKSREEARAHLALLVDDLEARYPKAAECAGKDWDALLRYFDFPQAHWVHLKTSNPIESIFSGVRLRTRVIRRFQRVRTGVAFVFKVLERLSMFWSVIEQPQLLLVWQKQRDKVQEVAAA